MGNRRYDPDFKREAVRMVVEDGMDIREVERSLGITFGVLKRWVQKHQKHQDAAFVGRVVPDSPEAELKRLHHIHLDCRELALSGCYLRCFFASDCWLEHEKTDDGRIDSHSLQERIDQATARGGADFSLGARSAILQ